MKSRRWSLVLLATLGLSASLLTACTFSTSGGIAGAVVTLLIVLATLAFGVTQTGCDEDDTTDDEIYADPCLSAPMPEDVEEFPPVETDDRDAGEDEEPDAAEEEEPDGGEDDKPDAGEDETTEDTGPPEDAVKPVKPDEPEVGPCLEPLMEEPVEPPEKDGDSERELPPLGPCLTMMMNDSGNLDGASDDERRALLDKMRQRLPDDVVSRLEDGSGGDADAEG